MIDSMIEPVYRPAQVPCTDSAYKNRPINYPVYEQAWHFRAKVQEFSAGGYEATVTSINLQRHADRQAEYVLRGSRTERKGDADSILKATRRAKRMVRLKCKEMGADHLFTLTTRLTLSRDELQLAWSKFCDIWVYYVKEKFDYVCVPEPHPTNPQHLHLHVAVRGRMDVRVARRCWYIALGSKANVKGSDTPGNIDIQKIKVSPTDMHRRMDKIASYISKYITKDQLNEFNKKRYWATRIALLDARTYWLKARTVADAIAEFCETFHFVRALAGPGDFFQARSIDLAWFRLVPDDPGGGGLKISTCPF